MMRQVRVIPLAVLCCWVVGCGSSPTSPPAKNSPEKAAVHRVIETMQVEQTQLKKAWQQSASEGKTPTPTDFYFVEVATLEKVDLAGCPADFTEAFRNMIRARQRQLRVATKYKTEVPRWEAWSLIERLGDSPDMPVHEREIVAAAKEYNAAWDNLGSVCARYK